MECRWLISYVAVRPATASVMYLWMYVCLHVSTIVCDCVVDGCCLLLIVAVGKPNVVLHLFELVTVDNLCVHDPPFVTFSIHTRSFHISLELAISRIDPLKH
jgi:hypothetical protein